jgi:hypothetical protein
VTDIDPARPFATVSPSDTDSVDETTLRDALSAVQTVVEPLAVADIVFEYRQTFETDPLTARHGDAYYLAVPPRVWPEFVDVLELPPSVADACRAVHADRFHAVVGTPPDEREPLVLVG